MPSPLPTPWLLSQHAAPRDRSLTCGLTVRGSKLHQPIGYARNFPGKTSRKPKFTANANQSNENVTYARVAGTEVCACHRGNKILPPRKLIFNTPEFEFYQIYKLYMFPFFYIFFGYYPLPSAFMYHTWCKHQVILLAEKRFRRKKFYHCGN